MDGRHRKVGVLASHSLLLVRAMTTRVKSNLHEHVHHLIYCAATDVSSSPFHPGGFTIARASAALLLRHTLFMIPHAL